MKKNILCRVSIACMLLLLYGGNLLSAQDRQNTGESLKTIYNTPFSYTLDHDLQWELKNEFGHLVSQGTGSITDHIFSKPGNYALFIHENHKHSNSSCDNNHFPSKQDVTVSPMKMIFDFSSVKLSQNIIGRQSTKDITLSVNVNYSSYDDKNTVYKQGFTTAGVGTSVVGKLKNGKTTLKQGVNTLEFILEGVAEKGNYIMIDFIDINGQIQCYAFNQKIQ